jgi:hypothetical protein
MGESRTDTWGDLLLYINAQSALKAGHGFSKKCPVGPAGRDCAQELRGIGQQP